MVTKRASASGWNTWRGFGPNGSATARTVKGLNGEENRCQ
jgi:hypothetical protein